MPTLPTSPAAAPAPSWPDFLSPEDVAPGDRKFGGYDFSGLRCQTVAHPDDPALETGFVLLDAEFGWRGEMEPIDVLRDRLAWPAPRPSPEPTFIYRMMLLWHHETCIGVRDHTAIHWPGSQEIIVHLSHVWLDPAWRGKGLAAILRALPMQSARQCAAVCGLVDPVITLAAEMDPWNPDKPECVRRTKSYQQAGYLKVDPSIAYRQPDFRPAVKIDAHGGPCPVPLDLVLRRVGRESEHLLAHAELVTIVRALYALYAMNVRQQDMQPCHDWFAHIAQDWPTSTIALVPPCTPPRV